MKKGTTSLSLLLRLWLIGCWLLPATCDGFTVILSDSNAPATLLDTPQTGIFMKNGGGRTDPKEQQAVYDVMRATGNDWATTIPDVCKGRWHGIECMPDRDEVYHVVSLSFGSLSDDTAFPTCDPASSFLSPSLARLPHLRSLFFYRCFPSNPQPLPAFLGLLGPTLHSLVLRDNGHVGSIPSELANLTHLRVLDLHSNRLSSSIPPSLSALSRLRSLDLSGNRLTGPIPDLPTDSLDVLDLSGNLLDGPFPLSLCKAQRLIKMDLSWNRLAGPIPDSLSGLKSLMLLDLSRNLLTGPLPASIGSLESLRSLVLEGNPMHSAQIPPDVFSQLKNLTVLVLSNMGLCGPIPESIAQLPALRVLHLDRNRLNGTIPEGFRNLRKISELRLDNNQLVGAIPFDRETLWRMRWKLRLSNNSGLCHEAGGGDVPFLLGVQSCPAVEDGLAVSTATQHDVSSLDLRHSMSGGGPMHYVAVSRTNAGSHCRLPASAFYCLVLLWFLTL